MRAIARFPQQLMSSRAICGVRERILLLSAARGRLLPSTHCPEMTDDPIRTRIAGFDGPCGETVWRTLKTGQCSRSGLCGPRLAIRFRQKKGAGTKQMLSRWPACGSSLAVLAVNHRTRIARDPRRLLDFIAPWPQ